ncbi:hypothetical protein [Candidatus Methylacidithermus pantelleriae]|nr:hypothetical protein [Candidatus Methylacidithermus pantelleriae]
MKSMDNGWGMFDNMEVWILDIAYELGSAFLNCELQRLAMGEIAIGEEGKEG